jgi:hypothetical protein
MIAVEGRDGKRREAKNYIARAFRAVVDPHPPDESLSSLWQHFQSRCAYCGIEIARAPKQAHYDHLASSGGSRLSNFVLSCPDCNERKRDLDWQRFLRGRCSDEQIFQSRRATILAWQQQAQQHDAIVDPVLLDRADVCIAKVYSVFDQQLSDLRAFKKNGGDA